VQHAAHARRAGLAHHRGRVGIGVARMDDDRAIRFRGERELRREGTTLQLARRVVVVVVEAALADRDRAFGHELRDRFAVGDGIERRRVVRVYAGRENDEARMRCRDPGRRSRLLDGFADADDSYRARIAGAIDYRAAVAGERRVGEVGVAVEEAVHLGLVAFVARGYLCSIQRSTGPAM